MTILTGLPDRRVVLTGLAHDDSEERWITINGGDGDGQAVMIGRNTGGSGWVIKGGAGGALNGTVVHPKSMSGPAPAPTKPAADPRIAEAHRLSDVANNGEKRTHLETHTVHKEAAMAHKELAAEFSTKRYDAKGKGDDDAAREAHAQYHVHNDKYYEHAIAANKARDKHFNAEKREAKKQRVAEISETDDGKALIAREKTFEKGTAAEIHDQLKNRFGLGLYNGSNAHREYRAAHQAFKKNYSKMTPEERDAAREHRDSLYAAARRTHSNLISSHTEYDIDDGSPQAKAARKAMGHVHHALESLESMGYDVKSALTDANVAYAPGNVGKALGHAYQHGGVGYFTMSAGKSGLDYQQGQIDIEKRSAEKGKQRWTIGADSGLAGLQRAVAIHELAHALGMQPHINSPAKLRGLLNEHVPGGYGKQHEWIVNNISRYGAKNIHETDAELAALVTSPNYVRGTLPKPFEDHVDALFHKKKDV